MLRIEPVFTDIEMKEHCAKAIRYCPVGDSADHEIGELFVPLALTHNEAPRLRIHIAWPAILNRNSCN